MSFLKFYFIFFQLLSLSLLSIATCPPNSTPGTNNGKCYSFMTATADFVSAERSCSEVGGHLVSICNAFENSFLADIAVGKLQDYGAKDFWIGYNDLYNKGLWNWTSSASCSFTNWGSGQPGISDCASFQISGGKWQGADCTTPKAFVCETYSVNQSVKPMCKSGYTYYDEWNTCYKYFTTPKIWADAEQSCVNDGGHLVSIHSKNEETFIDAIMHTVSAYDASWIGFYTIDQQDASVSQFWTWTDGTPAIYTDWEPSFPRKEYTCAYMYSSGNPWGVNGSMYWGNDYNCSSAALNYICKQFPLCG